MKAKKLLSMLLVLCMVFSLLPAFGVTAFAADYPDSCPCTKGHPSNESHYYLYKMDEDKLYFHIYGWSSGDQEWTVGDSRTLGADMVVGTCYYGNDWSVCYSSGPAHEHGGITFTAWTTNNSLPTTAGNYYLDTDVTLNATWTVPTGTTSLCLNGHVIKLADNKSISVIKVPANATLNIYDCGTTEHAGYVDANGLWHLGTGTGTAKKIIGGVITGGNATDFGGGVFVDSGSFTLHGGNIVGNKAQRTGGYAYGGGVYVKKGNFTQTGGSITNNTAAYGGGVSVGGGGTANTGGSFTLNGGNITGNTATGSGSYAGYGGGVFVDSGSFTLNDGSITGNTADCTTNIGYGGGVYVYNSTFTMNGGSIAINTMKGDKGYGGGAFVSESTFTMEDGSITGNTANHGGGAYVYNKSTFTMKGGSITGNTADCTTNSYGGGVYVNNSTFTMECGSITGNKADYGGGILNNGKSYLTAATDKTITITGNTANKVGGGIYNWGEMHLSGKVIIKDNACTNGTDYPVNLATIEYNNSNHPIFIDGALSDSDIHVTHVDYGSGKHSTGVLTSGFKTQNSGAKLGDFFTYEGPDSYKMVLNASGELEVVNTYAITNGAPQASVSTSHGYLTVDKTTAAAGETVTVTVTPSTGYQLKANSLKATYNDGSEDKTITPTQDETDKTKYTFTMPAYAVTVTAAFEETTVAQIGDTKYATLAEALAAVPTDGTATEIKLLADCASGGISIPSGVNLTIDFNGKTVTFNKPGAGSTGTKTIGFQILQGSTVVMKGGKLECAAENKDATWESTSTEKGIAMMIQNYANLTLDGMTIDGQNIAHNGNPGTTRYVMSNNSGTVNINNTTITAADGDFAFDACKYGSYAVPTVNVNGTSAITGNMELTGGKLTAADTATITGTIKTGTGYNDGDLTVPKNSTLTAPDGYEWVENTDGTTKSLMAVAQVMIGDKRYATLADALADAKDGDEIKLIKDITITEQLVIDKAITFDGNGKTITRTPGGATAADKAGILVTAGATIKNLTVSGPNTTASGWDSGEFGIKLYNATGATLDGVTVSGANAGIQVNGGSVTMKNNITVSGNEFGGIELCHGGTLNLSAATLVNAGETDANPVLWNDDTKGTITANSAQPLYLKAADENKDHYYLSGEAVLGDVGYRNLAEALEAAKDGDTVKLGADIASGTENVTVPEGVIFDLNHHVLKTTGTVTNNGTIVLHQENADIVDYLLYNVPGNYAADEELKLPNDESPDYVIPAKTFMTAKVGTDPAYQELGFASGEDMLVWNKDVPAGMQLKVTYSLTLGGDILSAKTAGIKDTNVTAVNFALNNNISIGSNTETDGTAVLNVTSIYDEFSGNTIASFTANDKKITLNKTGKLVISSDATGFDESVLVSGVQGMSVVKTEDTTAKTVTYSLAVLPPAAGDDYSIDFAAEKITVNDGYEISIKNGTGSGNTFADGKLTLDGSKQVSLQPGTTYYIRKAASGDAPASEVVNLTVPARPAAPADSAFTKTTETVQNKKDGTFGGITVDMQYSINGGDWTSGPATLTGLSNETVKVRYTAKTDAFKSEEYSYTFTPSTAKLTVTANGTTYAEVAYGDKLEKPVDPTRTGYTFGGWYSDEELTQAWNFELDTVTDNVTLYPKWIRNNVQKAAITGKVTENNTGVAGATVELYLGTVKVAATVTDTNGDYSFDNVENGAYNIVVTKADGKTKTEMVTVNSTGNFSVNVELPDKAVSSVVEVESTPVDDVKSDVSKTVVGGLDTIAAAQTPVAGQTITIKLTVEPKEDENTEAQQAIKTEAGNGKKVEFLDMSLWKQVNDDTATDIGDSNNQLLTIVIPFDFTNVDVTSVMILRKHGTGNAEKLTKNPTSGQEGFTVDRQAGTITIYAMTFSDYALAYEEERDDPYIPYIPVTPSYSITGANTENGKLTLNRKNASAGQTVTITVTPDEGYELDTLTVKDAKGNALTLTKVSDTIYVFRMPDSKVTVSAAFAKIEVDTPVSDVCPQDATCVYAKFTDADTKAWYHDGVHFCVENGYMQGVSGTQFAPTGTTSRAMIVTILWRMEGKPTVDYTMSFKDVKADQWYTEAIRWAQSTGIVEGYSAEAFGPDDPITREQMATILYRFAKNHEIDVTNTNTLAGFADADKVSTWALDAMQWANDVGLVQGRTTTTLVPEADITRAEAATMVQRYCENIVK